jgi:transposase InsO family protein
MFNTRVAKGLVRRVRDGGARDHGAFVAPGPGQVWTRDTLKFRVAQFHLNSLYVTGYSDKASGMWVLIPHLDYTAETVIELDQKLRTFVRPINGEILRIKSDNHPSYKAKETFTYLAEAEIGPQFSPVYGHQMVCATSAARARASSPIARRSPRSCA